MFRALLMTASVLALAVAASCSERAPGDSPPGVVSLDSAPGFTPQSADPVLFADAGSTDADPDAGDGGTP
jgi:hypothetical protein